MPTPLTTMNPLTPATPPCEVMDEDNSWKVNPPTAQKLLIAAPVLKFHEPPANATGVLFGTANGAGVLKSPEVPETTGEIQEVTAVAVAAEPVL